MLDEEIKEDYNCIQKWLIKSRADSQLKQLEKENEIIREETKKEIRYSKKKLEKIEKMLIQEWDEHGELTLYHTECLVELCKDLLSHFSSIFNIKMGENN